MWRRRDALILATLNRMEQTMTTIQDDLAALAAAVTGLVSAVSTITGTLTEIETALQAATSAGSADPSVLSAIEGATAQIGTARDALTAAASAAQALVPPPAAPAAPTDGSAPASGG